MILSPNTTIIKQNKKTQKGVLIMALFLSNLGAAGIILTIAVMLASGFLLTRITKRLHLPNVTGYIIAGVIIGPWCLNLVPSQYIGQMDFITDLALAFIAFGVGKYFKLSSLKANGKKMVILTLFESLTAGIFITIVMLIWGYPCPSVCFWEPSAAPRPLPPPL